MRIERITRERVGCIGDLECVGAWKIWGGAEQEKKKSVALSTDHK
jgi:hypothetical protein